MSAAIKFLIEKQIELDAVKDAVTAELVAALQWALEYFEDRQDADHDQDGYIPNKEMQIASEIRRALDRAGVK